MSAETPSESGLRARIRSWFAGLPRARRLNLIKGGVVAVAALLVWAAYGAKKGGEEPPRPTPTKDVTTVSLGDARLEDDIRAQFERDRQDMVSQSSQQAKAQDRQAAELSAQQKQLELMQQALEAMAAAPGVKNGNRVPDDPEEWANAPTVSGERLNRGATLPPSTPAAVPQLLYVGDIGVAADPVLAAQRTAAPAASGDAKKTADDSFCRPVSCPRNS